MTTPLTRAPIVTPLEYLGGALGHLMAPDREMLLSSPQIQEEDILGTPYGSSWAQALFLATI